MPNLIRNWKLSCALIALAISAHWPAVAAEELSPDTTCAKKSVGFAGFITEANTGEVFSYKETSRFGICLDAKRHPLKNLDTTDCKSMIGHVSNWSFRGPNNYPIGFAVTGAGSCVIRNGAFHVRIVGTALE